MNAASRSLATLTESSNPGLYTFSVASTVPDDKSCLASEGREKMAASLPCLFGAAPGLSINCPLTPRTASCGEDTPAAKRCSRTFGGKSRTTLRNVRARGIPHVNGRNRFNQSRYSRLKNSLASQPPHGERQPALPIKPRLKDPSPSRRPCGRGLLSCIRISGVATHAASWASPLKAHAKRSTLRNR
jgi:hypothetical protein